ncbi:hypothetical protein [Brevibacillus laterosporus]|uniref:Uncharacterized protein n=1 Tax=Brevibacillus laterosporus TaxID=1465 RepID=A0AAP8U7F8_BRELA|nr:hypothetical protein [Brevibacillus laterosporus]MCR8979003.1 hypothetical protein [Brevibacillus laterosporus]MCZ0806159.1 hypothetical protein [Brevibacillus laterosporus]MCZ0824605.1 hypothetical protein [Brevibacillus laterosporus]MCZ0848627.1 hypothetical protein [Brevibacillus laterosporus]PPA81364.1 hypothetical protein C4A76_23685 [Brevibacillus laterosporus]
MFPDYCKNAERQERTIGAFAEYRLQFSCLYLVTNANNSVIDEQFHFWDNRVAFDDSNLANQVAAAVFAVHKPDFAAFLLYNRTNRRGT